MFFRNIWMLRGASGVRTLTPASLLRVTETIVRATGSESEEAAVVAEHLVEANLKGHDSHGVGMIPAYVSQFHKGLLFPNTPVKLLKDSGSILQFDGQRGYGQR
eukprot:RCo032464